MRRFRATLSQSRFRKLDWPRVGHIGTARVAGHSVRGTVAAFLNRDCEGAAPKTPRFQ
jgi:hypothetical protein